MHTAPLLSTPKKKAKYVFGTGVRENAVRGAWLKSESLKWLFPFLFAGVGFYCQSVGLHWATYQYIHKYQNAPNEYRTLYDSIEPNEAEKINMKTIDMIAGFIPMGFMAMTAFACNPMCRCRSSSSSGWQHADILRQNTLRIWTKVMTCAMFLFMAKGILGAITIVPDSSGWDVCENRLKSAGTMWMRQEHTFRDMLSVDAIWVYEHHTPLRYCADMMFSGHTFVVTLFALGTYELMRAFRLDQAIRRSSWGSYGPGAASDRIRLCVTGVTAIVKVSALTTFALLVIFEQIVEIWYVERSHFHYSMDVFMAIVLTFLVYTNGVIAVFAKHWTTWGFLIFFPCLRRVKDEDTEGTTDAECECPDPENIKWAILNSRGDIFIPPCCFPFCFYSGREHVYSDDGVKEIIKHFDDKKNEDEGKGKGNDKKDEDKDKDDKKNEKITAYLQNTMLLDEGVSQKDFFTAILSGGVISLLATPVFVLIWYNMQR